MERKEYLTNERLKGAFANNFDLANFAIKIAKEKIAKEENGIQVDLFINDLLKIIKEKKEKA